MWRSAANLRQSGIRTRKSSRLAPARYLERKAARPEGYRRWQQTMAAQIEPEKGEGQRVFGSLPLAYTRPRYSPESTIVTGSTLLVQRYWFKGLKPRIAPSAAEQTPAGSTRITASSSAQKPRIPVWFTESGIALMV